MKIAVFILGILGAIAGGGLGLKWLSDSSAHADTIKKLEDYEKQVQISGNKQAATTLSNRMSDLNNVIRAAYLLVIGSLAGLTALVMLYLGKLQPRMAGVVLILGSLLAGLFAPVSLVFSGLMLIAGGLCFRLQPTVKEQTAVVA